MKMIASALVVTCVILLCGRLAGGQVTEQKSAPFDTYGAVNAEYASWRLDDFANELHNQPDAIGFLISYGPVGKGPGTADHVLDATRGYLVNTRGIDSNRIQIMNAGRFKDPADLMNELWIIPPGVSPPEPQRYNARLKEVSGKFAEVSGGYFGNDYGHCCGFDFGDPTPAAFTDLLREQPKSVGYIVAFYVGDAARGAWRPMAKRNAADMQYDGIEADRIKILFGGRLKRKKKNYSEVTLQYWILPADAPPPVREAKPGGAPKVSVRIGLYHQSELEYSWRERETFEGFADYLRADEQLRVCFLVRPEIPSGEMLAKLAEKWKSELRDKLGIKENRIFIIHAGANEYHGGTLEVWVVPPGASLPDPHAYVEE
jgi:hypothetical protein